MAELDRKQLEVRTTFEGFIVTLPDHVKELIFDIAFTEYAERVFQTLSLFNFKRTRIRKMPLVKQRLIKGTLPIFGDSRTESAMLYATIFAYEDMRSSLVMLTSLIDGYSNRVAYLIMMGAYEELGISDEEAGRFLYYHFEKLAEEYGIEALEHRFHEYALMAAQASLIVPIQNAVTFAFLDEASKVRITASQTIKLLEGLDVSRIRICPICADMFWAGRSNMVACGRKCAAVDRTRRWRDKVSDEKKDQYNRMRRIKRKKVKENEMLRKKEGK